MRFTVVALAVCQSLALRPELGRVRVSQSVERLGEVFSKISSPSDSLVALKEASGLLNGILAEMGNATDHISGDDADLLSSVITLVEKTIYSSMDDAHEADVSALDNAIQTASSCNADIAQRQSPEGDLGHLHQAVQDKQTELNRLQEVADDKTEANNTAYDAFDSHNQMIAPAPDCPGLPARTMPALDIFFDESEYVIWYTAQQSAYSVVREAFVAADKALEEAIEAYEIQRAVRDTQYCDWRSELEAACAAFDVCFSEASEYYTNELVPRVTSSMNGRIEIKKAGDTVVHQIQFLLGQVEDQATPEIDTSRYEIDFLDLPAKGLCDLSPLDADEWVPQPFCSPPYCLRITTGEQRSDDGTLAVMVSTGLSVLEVALGQHFQLGDTVADVCYRDPISWVDVQNPTNNAWAGSVLYSTFGENFNALSCTKGCVGNGDTSDIVVDGDENSGNLATLRCFSGSTCRLAVS